MLLSDFTLLTASADFASFLSFSVSIFFSGCTLQILAEIESSHLIKSKLLRYLFTADISSYRRWAYIKDELDREEAEINEDDAGLHLYNFFFLL